MSDDSPRRGARALTAPPVDAIVLDEDALAERNQALAQMSAHQQAVIEQFGDGLPWSPQHYEAEIRNELRRGVEAFIRAGRYLVVVRECASHGEWLGMLSRLGIEPRQSQRMMEAAKRIKSLSNASTSTHLLRAAESSGKMIELLSLPEDQFTELAEEGETEGLKLEDIARMSVRELRAAVREARADIAAKDERADKREREIERLQAALDKARGRLCQAPVDEQMKELRERANKAACAVRAELTANLAAQARGLLSYGESTGVEQRTYLAGLVHELMTDLAVLRDELALPILESEG